MMTSLKNYQDLEVWKKSIELGEVVYRVSARFPLKEKFGLTGQIASLQKQTADVGRMLNGLKRSLRSKT